MESALYQRSRFKTATLRKSQKSFRKYILRKSYWYILLVLRAIYLAIFLFVGFLLIEDYEQGALQKELIIGTSVEEFKIATLRKF